MGAIVKVALALRDYDERFKDFLETGESEQVEFLCA
jgi:hypothetical protein